LTLMASTPMAAPTSQDMAPPPLANPKKVTKTHAQITPLTQNKPSRSESAPDCRQTSRKITGFSSLPGKPPHKHMCMSLI
jgi:hypothetical protein